MTTTEINQTGTTELTLILATVEYSSIPRCAALGQEIKAELIRRKALAHLGKAGR